MCHACRIWSTLETGAHDTCWHTDIRIKNVRRNYGCISVQLVSLSRSGSAILVRPVLDEGASGVNIHFPGEGDSVWYDAHSLQQFPGNSKVRESVSMRVVSPRIRLSLTTSVSVLQTYMPVTLESQPYFYRGGYIVPRKDRVRRSASLMTDDPYTLVVALDSRVNNILCIS